MRGSLLVLCIVGLFCFSTAADRYEAENAIVDENSVAKTADANASGGFFVGMKEGNLSFNVTVTTTGFYTLWAAYSQPNDPNGKIQNLSVGGASKGQISFPFCSTFVKIKASSKLKLSAGVNKIDIIKSWGWVNLDYIEITPYEATPFTINGNLVSPNASDNAKKMFGFLQENFQKKIVSGIMTNNVMQNDGKYTPDTLENQTEIAWIIAASKKTPVLIGVDFLHATGKGSEGEWHHGYTNATLALAENTFRRGGIPAYCWHWQDPTDSVEAFYTASSGSTPFTTFNLNKAFTDTTTYSSFDTTSKEYKGIIQDLDVIAGYLKTLADKGVPVLWRPLHESSGKWFWWGYRGPGACKALYRLMFDRFTGVHKLNNLIWVWTTDEASDAMNWYPGDKYVDIVGRDYYYYPREANHGSLVASFEKVKEIFNGTKLIALSENGSIPHPDSLVGDGAGWSYFMPWYGEYAMDGWAHDNTAADWNSIMNNPYVITLDKMPGWDKYVPPAIGVRAEKKPHTIDNITVRYASGTLVVKLTGAKVDVVELYNLRGSKIAGIHQENISEGKYRFKVGVLAKGIYIAQVKKIGVSGVFAVPVMVK